jgi:hypothetical protein
MHTHAGVIWQLQDGANAWYINSIEWGQSQEETCLHMDLRATYELWRSKSPWPPKKQTRSWPNTPQQWMYMPVFIIESLHIPGQSIPSNSWYLGCHQAISIGLELGQFSLSPSGDWPGDWPGDWRLGQHLKLDPMTKLVVKPPLTIVTHRNYIDLYLQLLQAEKTARMLSGWNFSLKLVSLKFLPEWILATLALSNRIDVESGLIINHFKV